MSVNVYGPAGCGKSHHAEALKKRFGCKRIRDGVTAEDLHENKARSGDLLLSQQPLPGVRSVAFVSLGIGRESAPAG